MTVTKRHICVVFFLSLLAWQGTFEYYRLKGILQIGNWREKKNLAKRCQSTWKGTEKMYALLCQRRATVLFSHSWIQNRMMIFLSMTCIGFLGRRQLLDDNVFIYVSFSLFVFLNSHFFHLFMPFVIFFLQSKIDNSFQTNRHVNILFLYIELSFSEYGFHFIVHCNGHLFYWGKVSKNAWI